MTTPLDMPPMIDSDTESDTDNDHSDGDIPALFQESSDEAEDDEPNSKDRIINLPKEQQPTGRRMSVAEAIIFDSMIGKNRAEYKKNAEDLLKEKEERERQETQERKRLERHKRKQQERQEAKERNRLQRNERKQMMAERRKAQQHEELLDKLHNDLVRGTELYLASDFKNALPLLQFVTKSLKGDDLNAKTTRLKFDHIAQYMTIRCAFETDNDCTREKYILGELDRLLHDHPVSYIYWLYGRAMNKYQPRSDRTETFLSRASELLCTLQMELLPESNTTHLQGLIDKEMQIWHARPTPDGRCNSAACSSVKIYWGEDGPLCSRISCSLGHSFLYHKSCWRNMCKKVYGSISRDQLIGQVCPVLDKCSGTIIRQEDLSYSGAVRTCFEAPLPLTLLSNDNDDEKLEEFLPPSDEDKKEQEQDEDEEDYEYENENEDSPTEPEASKEEGEDIAYDDVPRTLVDAFSVDLSTATVLLPRKPETTPVKKEPIIRKKRKDKITMSLGEFWKTEEEKEAVREDERRAIKARLPELERDLDDLHQTVKLLARRPTKKLTKSRPLKARGKAADSPRNK